MSAHITCREPRYPDQSHPIYRALPMAEALDTADQFNRTAGDMHLETALLKVGDAAGGLSVCGFRHDLLAHVEAESYAENRAASPYILGRDAAAQWIDDVTTTLRRHGYAIDVGQVVSLALEIA